MFPDLEYHVQPLSLDAFGEPLHAFAAITASVCNLNPTSRGTVHIRSARPEDARDRAALPVHPRRPPHRSRVAAPDAAHRQPAMARYAPKEVKPGVQYESDDDLARLAGDIATTIFHPVGTCRMGRADDAAAVVDPRLKLRGVGQRVVVERDADDHEWQHQLARVDDRRARGAVDDRGSRSLSLFATDGRANGYRWPSRQPASTRTARSISIAAASATIANSVRLQNSKGTPSSLTAASAHRGRDLEQRRPQRLDAERAGPCRRRSGCTRSSWPPPRAGTPRR